MGFCWNDTETRREHLQRVAAPAEAPPGDPHRVHHRASRPAFLHDLPGRNGGNSLRRREIEADVMSDDDRPAHGCHCRGHLLEERGLAFDHLLRNPGQGGNAGADFPLRIDQLLMLGDFLTTRSIRTMPQLDDAMPEFRRRACWISTSRNASGVSKRG